VSNQIDLDVFKIYLPDGDSKSFMIYHDFAPLFGLSFQHDAVKAIRKAVKLSNFEKAPKIYWGENHIGIRTGSPEVIYKIARAIDGLLLSHLKINLSDKEWLDIRTFLVTWKIPRRQKWRIGDIFSITLFDGTFAFGQILSDKPTVVVFDYKNDGEDIIISELAKKRILTILHVTDNSLNNWNWKVIGSNELLADKEAGPHGSYSLRIGLISFGCSVVESVCNYYWFKISTWVDENDFKELIMLEL